MRTSIAISLIVLLAVTGCAASPSAQPGEPALQPVDTPTATSVPPAEPVPTWTVADPSQPAQATAVTGKDLSPVARARADLASRLGIAPGQIEFVGLAPVTQSSDASECPSPSARERAMVVDPEGNRYELPQKGALPGQEMGLLLFFTVEGKSYVYYQVQDRVTLCPDLD
jgi:hypothetical protein